MHTISRDQSRSCFDHTVAPVVEIAPGTRIVLETEDACGGRMQCADDVFTREFTLDQANPVTGPVAISGAEPGDALRVVVERIDVRSPGYRVLLDGTGIIKEGFRAPKGMMVEIRDGQAIYPCGVSIPARPMIGTLGTTPADGPVLSIHPGRHGGNMDVNIVQAGTVVYLPVFVRGGLLAAGDLHASMGDGELTGGGIDIGGEVQLKIDLLSGEGTEWPWFETEDSWGTFGCAPDIASSVRIATKGMIDLLGRERGLEPEDAYLLIGSHGDACLGQIGCLGQIDVTACLQFPRIEVL